MNPWDAKTVDEAIRELSNTKDGPDWYFHTTGTKENPVRRLVVRDYLGLTEAADGSGVCGVDGGVPGT